MSHLKQMLSGVRNRVKFSFIYIYIVHIFFFICLYVYILSCLVFLNLNKKIKKKNKNIREKNNIKYVNVDSVIEVENRRVISERKHDEKLYDLLQRDVDG